MNPELDKKLCEKYPKIFSDRYNDPKDSCVAFGIECGDGWYKVIDMLCLAASTTYSTGIRIDKEDATKYGIESPDDGAGERYYFSVESPQIVASQIKEKFGSLRFYYRLEFDPKVTELIKSEKYPELQKVVDHFHVYFDGIVHMAEILSVHTCEITGGEGEMHVSNGGKSGWYKTLNREYAKSESFYVDRNYVPFKDIPKE